MALRASTGSTLEARPRDGAERLLADHGRRVGRQRSRRGGVQRSLGTASRQLLDKPVRHGGDGRFRDDRRAPRLPDDVAGSVHYATADGAGTATAGADYTSTSGTLVFAPGETHQTFTVPVLLDNVAEPDETVVLSLSNAIGAVLGAPHAATLTISDGPRAGFAGAQTFAAVITGSARVFVTLSAPSNVAVSVDYATASGGTAVAGADYTPASGTLTFAPGESSADLRPLAGEQRNRSAREDDCAGAFESGEHVDRSGRSTATVVTEASAAACSICSTLTVNENAGSLTVTVDLPSPAAQATTINYATSDGTATAGADYTARSGSLLFGVGESRKTITIPILADQIYDPDETFSILFSGDAVPTLGPIVVVNILDASIVVGSTSQTGGNCTLTSAIQSANLDLAIGGCQAGTATMSSSCRRARTRCPPPGSTIR